MYMKGHQLAQDLKEDLIEKLIWKLSRYSELSTAIEIHLDLWVPVIFTLVHDKAWQKIFLWIL